MSNYPPSASKLLSTLSSASSSSSDHQNLSKKSCTGVFYQLLDWNRRLHKKHPFRHRSLPAERPASPPMKESVSTDEKFPSVLMVDDENKGRCKTEYTKPAEDSRFPKDQTPEKKRKKKSPNVVAKLMGLETMPSPDLCREKWSMHSQDQASMQRFKGKSLFSDSKVSSSRRSLGSADGEVSSSRRDFGSKLSLQDAVPTSDDKTRACNDRDGQELDQILGFTTKVDGNSPPGQRIRPLGCVLSPSNVHNRMFSPIKIPLSSKAKVCLFEAASKALEPGPHPRNAHIKTMGPRRVPVNCKSENDKENNNKVSQRPMKSEHVSSRLYSGQTSNVCESKQEDKASSNSASRLKPSSSRGQTPSSSSHIAISREETTGRQLKRGRTGHDDKDSANCSHGPGHVCLKVFTQEQGLGRRINAPAKEKAQTFTRAPAIANEKDPNPLRTRRKLVDLDEHRRSLSDRSTPSTTTCNRRCDTSTSVSRIKGKTDSGVSPQESESKVKSVKTHARLDPLPLKKTLLAKSVRTKAPEKEPKLSSSCESSVSEQQSMKGGSTLELQHNKQLNGHLNQDNLSFSEDHSLEALPIIMDHQDEGISIDSMVENDGLERRGIDDVPITVKDSRQDMGITNTHNESSCSSITEEVRDTASSMDIYGHKRKQMVSYSGKSTATILQELLLALNPSGGRLIEKVESDQADSCVSGLTTVTATDAMAENSGGDKHDYCTLSAEDSGCASNPDRHTLEECRDVCWQLSPTISSLASPSDCSESLEDIQDGQCTRLGCRERLRIGRNINLFSTRQLKEAGILNQIQEDMVQSEEDYVKCILEKAKISVDDILSVKLQITNSIIDALMFDKIEEITVHNWARGTKVDLDNPCNHLFFLDQYVAQEGYGEYLEFLDEEMARGYRKLVFDCVDEALRVDVGVGEVQAQAPYLDLPLQARCNRVLRHVHDWRGMRCGMNVDDMVEKEMNMGLGTWANFSRELSEVGADVEVGIMADLIDEVVFDLSSFHRRRIPMVKVATQEVPDIFPCAKAGGRRLVWVGL